MCFSWRLKVSSVCDAVTLDGKLFQMRGAATKIARSPLWNDAMTTLQEQMLTHSAVASCVNVRHTTQLVHQILRSRTMQTVEHEHAEFKLNSLTHRQPMKVAE